MGAPPTSGPAPTSQPDSIGRYRVIRLLGRGGMGRVYLAEDPLLKRRVAIKVVREGDEAKNLALVRFRREAEISAQLNHPNAITVFDVGVDDIQGPFLAMEFVEGHSLAWHIDKKDLDLEACGRVLIQTMRALRAAHRQAIVHRDVKPENILLSEEGRAKLMDFGIARTLGHMSMQPEGPLPEDQWGAEADPERVQTIALRLTATGEFLGSPVYAAPEILRGSPGTPSSDRFAFAASAFELITGQLPHPGDNVFAIINHALTKPPAIPNDLHAPLGNVFRRALATDPDDRQATLLEFMEELIDTLPAQVSVRSRLFALLNQEEDGAGMIAHRRRSNGEHTSPGLKVPTNPDRKRSGQVKIRLNDDKSVATQWGAGKPLPRPSEESEEFNWKRTVVWTIVVIVILQIFWLIYPKLSWSLP
jgi:serine/threonine protein kinase